MKEIWVKDRALVFSGVCLLLCIASWIKFSFFYNPATGVFPLLLAIPIGLIGIVPSMSIQHQRLRYLLTVSNLILAGSILYPIVVWGLWFKFS